LVMGGSLLAHFGYGQVYSFGAFGVTCTFTLGSEMGHVYHMGPGPLGAS
jgi:hypothetical protein